MPKLSRPSKKSLLAVLVSYAVDPRSPTPAVAAILDLNDPKYLENRAMEELMTLRQITHLPTRSEITRKAITLLGLALLLRDGADSTPKVKAPKPKPAKRIENERIINGEKDYSQPAGPP